MPGLVELYTVLAGETVTRGNPGRDYIAGRLESLRKQFTSQFRKLAYTGAG